MDTTFINYEILKHLILTEYCLIARIKQTSKK